MLMNFTGMLWNQLKEFKVYYFFGVIALIFTHKIQSELPFMAKELADYVAKNNNELRPSLFFLCALGIIVFRTSSRILFFFPARLLQKFLRSELLEKLESNTPQRFRHLNAGQLFQYLSGDIDQIRALIGFVGLQGANFVIAFFILIPKMVSFNPHLLLALTPMLGAFIIFTVIVSKNRKYFKLTQDMQGEVQNLIMESYVGKRTIKNFHAEASFMELFGELSLKELYYFYRSSLGISITMPLISLGVGLSMLWGAYIIKSYDLGATTLILFSGFVFLFMEPMGYLSWIGVVVSRSHASWGRLKDLDLTLTTSVEAEEKLKNLNTTLTDNNYKLPFWDRALAVSFKTGAWNVLIAKTGHGKSEILLKLAEVLRQRGQSISLVAQDPYIFNDTMERNIFLGKKESDQEREHAKVMLKILGLDYLEPNMENLMKMEVGENGKRLSGGQAKRLSLVRSLMSGADILIWDDPFSSVDLILEKEIIQELKKQPMMKNKTLILTSHRLSTVRHSDYLLFVDKEEGIIEEGQVNQLLKENSKTYEYFQKQMV
ncbi:ATP-binding cassette subfamily B protein [Bacteriovorax stolpii]|nr:ABC transporter ATP-binding protein [Bacteriovorax stolpii]TDP51705.1 ATP-binding cassette subfamily B protein [Bacteriovorax stolpii]